MRLAREFAPSNGFDRVHEHRNVLRVHIVAPLHGAHYGFRHFFQRIQVVARSHSVQAGSPCINACVAQHGLDQIDQVRWHARLVHGGQEHVQVRGFFVPARTAVPVAIYRAL